MIGRARRDRVETGHEEDARPAWTSPRRRSTRAYARVQAFLAAVACVAVAACGGSEETPPASGEAMDADALTERARRLAQDTILVDAHVDVPYRLFENPEDIAERTPGGHFDFPRAKQGGLDAPFMSIYVSADYQGGGAKEHADALIDLVESWVTAAPDKFEIAISPADVRRIAAEGKIAFPLGMENGAPIEGDLANLEHFRRRGVRYITLTHSADNHICDSSYSDPESRRWGGLSPFGEELVGAMNRAGILVDVSHVSDAAFDRVLEVAEVPVIASHSSCRHFTPGWERNLDDDRIRAIAANGGVFHVNFGSTFLTEDANTYGRTLWNTLEARFQETGAEWGSPEAERMRDEYVRENPAPSVTVEHVADHIDRVVELAGIDHVGIGSDYDGVASVPDGLEDVSTYPALIRELLERGYTDDDIRKIWSGNVLRVWEQAERYAAEHGS